MRMMHNEQSECLGRSQLNDAALAVLTITWFLS
jgi:hypothetical protein